jgi:two-component system CheB/CheR fusion protein
MAFVFIPHLASLGERLFRDLLSKATYMPAVDAEDGMTVQPDHVYVIPPGYDMTIFQGKLRLVRLPQPRSSNQTVDIFLRSLAADQGRDAIGIILSGMASDGTLGLAAVKRGGGTTFAQDASAKFASMPNSAIAAGWVDLVLSPQAMAAELAHMDSPTKAAPHINKKMHGERRKAETDLPETTLTRLPPGGGPSSGHLRLRLETSAVVIAVVKSPRNLLRLQAQRILDEANQHACALWNWN